MMISAVDAITNLNDCGCCEGVSAETPFTVFNRPGLSAIVYRVGIQADFKETLVARLSGSNLPALRKLTTRDDDDFTIALLDAWASVGDVLTFYQERIANESYLRTATERLSVLELARVINYQLRPGVAASAYVAFTLEDAKGALGQALAVGTTAQIAPEKLPPITIGSGTKIQSIPGPEEQAQTFETIEEIKARVTWNAIRPRLTQPQPIETTKELFFFTGTDNNLKKGDRLLIVNEAGDFAIKSILKVTLDDKANTTRVDFATNPPPLPDFHRPGLTTGAISDFVPASLSDNNSLQIISQSWQAQDVFALAQMQGWSLQQLETNIVRHTSVPSLLTNAGVFAFRQQAGIFGHNAPHYTSLLKPNSTPMYPHAWDPNGFEIWRDSLNPLTSPPTTGSYYADADIFLERNLSSVTKDTWVVLELSKATETQRALFMIWDVKEASVSGFGISAKSTGLRLAKPNGTQLLDNATDKPSEFLVRKTNVLVQSEKLPLTELPIPGALDPASMIAGLTLDGPYIDLLPGQRITITGEQSDLAGVIVSESLILKDVVLEGGFTVVTFTTVPIFSYVRDTVVINANVALATHGETVNETLGGGDATQAFQRFVLKQPPVTYVSDSNPTGALTTLEVRVNDILWREVPDFFGYGPNDRIYITRLDDDGKTTVIFGNGETGARLPTGQENVKAKYRKGIGAPGIVKANQLTQLMTRPLGVKGVTNPVAASGAADPEKLADARRNAPLTILTLGRIVSLQDYQDFARAFSGIDKALATPVQVGEKNGVFVTIAGTKGATVATDSSLFLNLLTAIEDAGDPTVPFIVKSYHPRFFRLSAQVKIDPDFLTEKVLEQIEKQLREEFSFEARDFGQPVHRSEVIALIQSVKGVVSVNVTQFYRSDESSSTSHLHLVAAVPARGGEDLTPAEILMLDPQPVVFEVLR